MSDESERALADSLMQRALALDTAGHDDEAMRIYDGVYQRWRDSIEPLLQGRACQAMALKGNILNAHGHHQKALDAYNTLLASTSDATQLDVLRPLADALNGKAVALGSLARHSEAMAAYRELIGRFGGAADPGLRSRVAQALYLQASDLSERGLGNEALQLCDEILRRFTGAYEALDIVAEALFLKGVKLRQAGRTREAIETFDTLAEQFRITPSSLSTERRIAIEDVRLRALVDKAVAMAELGSIAEAIGACEEAAKSSMSEWNAEWAESGARALALRWELLKQMGRQPQ